MKTSLDDGALAPLLDELAATNRVHDAAFPGESGRRQPVHTVYGGAQLFKATMAPRLGELALASLDRYAPDAQAFATALQLPADAEPKLIDTLYTRVREKLGREAVEDFRIDYEDGFGHRPDDEEDAEALRGAGELNAGLDAGSLPPYFGIRIKPLTEELKHRSLRTLDLFLTGLCEARGGALPEDFTERFVVTLPKITTPSQAEVLARALGLLEARLGLSPESLKLELMIEVTPSIFGLDGAVAVRRLVDGAQGRCVAAHFGTYDYTASCGITAAHQHMVHGACDFARSVMQVALAGTGVWISDGATNVMPVPIHRAPPGESLSDAHAQENVESVHRAWRLHYGHVRHSLVNAWYQGWDLHPAQLPTRYAALYYFFLEGFDAAAERLSNFVAQASKATLVGEVFDDAATGQALLNYFLRAVGCGAVSEEEAVRRGGLTLDELRTRSFKAILEGRRG